MTTDRVPMPLQDAELRAHNFEEVALGYTPQQAADEAQRCLNCANPKCMSGCPVHVDIPRFVTQLKLGNIDAASAVIQESSCMAAICGRVCPQESQCEAQCVRGIKGQAVAIGRLERYVADHATHAVPQVAPSNGIQVAVVGSGPTGLACAGDLAKAGYQVTVYEALHAPGGVLLYGIPEFRLPKRIVRDQIEDLKAMGIRFVTDVVVGKTLGVAELLQSGYSAVYLGTGAGLPSFMGIEGEDLAGVYSANEYLTRSNLMGAYQQDCATPIARGGHVVVVGAGNVAMDAARTALRLGADKVSIVYRRSMAEMPARKEEIEHAMQEGIQFNLLCNPIAILGYEQGNKRYGHVRAIRCIRMALGEPDERGRRRPVPQAGSEFEMPVDTLIMAIGTSPNPLLRRATPDLEVNARGGIVVTADGATSIPMVWAGGDAVTGAATVISAMGAGKTAAKAIDEALRNKH